MEQTQQPNKRIVSKGQYALAQGKRATQILFGSGFGFGGVLFGLIAVVCLSRVPAHFIAFAATHHLTPLIGGLGYLVFGVLCGGCAPIFIGVGLEEIGESMKSEVVPVTRANTGNLPANDSLVRASQEPAQAQEALLLRASEERRREEQEGTLLRASAAEETVYVTNSH